MRKSANSSEVYYAELAQMNTSQRISVLDMRSRHASSHMVISLHLRKMTSFSALEMKDLLKAWTKHFLSVLFSLQKGNIRLLAFALLSVSLPLSLIILFFIYTYQTADQEQAPSHSRKYLV